MSYLGKWIISKYRTNGLVAFGGNERGSTLTAFTLLLPIVAAVVGMAVDYQRAAKYQQTLSMAADQALLAATTASSRGATTEAALAVAQQEWTANVGKVPGASVNANFKASTSKGQVGVSVSYKGQVATTFAQVMGISTIPVAGTASSQANVTTIQPKKYSGTGNSWGDPHLDGADGYTAEFMCPRPYWYNLLSDGGIEVNVACYHIQNGGTVGADMVVDQTVLLGSHVISIHEANPIWDYWDWRSPDLWHGRVTIDGTVYNPSQSGTLASWPAGTVTAQIGDGGDAENQGSDAIIVATPQYQINLGFNWQSGGGVVTFAATNAGTCGVPGGLWGQTLGGIDDTKASSERGGAIDASAFEVASGTSTSSEFSRTPCVTTIVSGLRLTQ